MKVHSTRGRTVVGGAALAAVLGVASVAAACVPGQGHYSDPTRFKVTPTSGGTGTQMTAVGNDLEHGNWPYQIKLINGTYTTDGTVVTNYDGRCGRDGIYQTSAKTNDAVGHMPVHNAPWTDHDFNHPFVLNALGLPAGPAFFCAIPGLEPTTSSNRGTEAYLTGFTII